MMKNVPFEILSYIFSHLDFASRREAALVCRSWYEASLDPVFLKKTKCVFNLSILDEETNLSSNTATIAGCLIKSPNLYIVGLDETFNAKMFLNLHKSGMKVLGPHVEFLSLKNANILEGTLVQILQYCPNLKSLDLSGCNSLLMSGSIFVHDSLRAEVAKKYLENLEELILSSSRYLNDSILCQLFNICPSIESLNLSSNNLICNSLGLSKKNSLTFLVVAQLLSVKANQIRSVDFSRTSIVSDALSMFAITKQLDLHSVILQNCRDLTDKGVINLVSHQSNITQLDLSGCSEIGNPSVFAICDHLNNLKSLCLRKCSKITSGSVKKLNKLNKLEELDISECHEVGMAALHSGLLGLEYLHTLKLKCCNLSRFSESFFALSDGMSDPVDGQHIASLTVSSISPASLFTSLQHLDIGSSRYVDDVTVQTVSVNLVNLRVLKLAWSPSVTDRGILGLPLPKSIFMTRNSSMEDQTEKFFSGGKYSNSHGHGGLIQDPGHEFRLEKFDMKNDELLHCMKSKGLVRLKNLRHLTLANCKKLSPFALTSVFNFNSGAFPQLEHLDLSMLPQAVNDDVLKAVATSSNLSFLSLGFCSMISDEGMSRLCRHLRFLSTLHVSSCDQLTHKFLRSLSQHCLWLKELDVSMCRQIDADAVDSLKKQLPSLLRVHTRFTGGASLDMSL